MGIKKNDVVEDQAIMDAVNNVLRNDLPSNPIRVNKNKDLAKLAKIKKKQQELKKELQNMGTNSYKKKAIRNNKIISKFYQQYQENQR